MWLHLWLDVMTNTAKTELVCNTMMMSEEDNMPTQKKICWILTKQATQKSLCCRRGKERAPFILFDYNYMPAQKAVRHTHFVRFKHDDDMAHFYSIICMCMDRGINTLALIKRSHKQRKRKYRSLALTGQTHDCSHPRYILFHRWDNPGLWLLIGSLWIWFENNMPSARRKGLHWFIVMLLLRDFIITFRLFSRWSLAQTFFLLRNSMSMRLLYL